MSSRASCREELDYITDYGKEHWVGMSVLTPVAIAEAGKDADFETQLDKLLNLAGDLIDRGVLPGGSRRGGAGFRRLARRQTATPRSAQRRSTCAWLPAGQWRSVLVPRIGTLTAAHGGVATEAGQAKCAPGVSAAAPGRACVATGDQVPRRPTCPCPLVLCGCHTARRFRQCSCPERAGAPPAGVLVEHSPQWFRLRRVEPPVE